MVEKGVSLSHNQNPDVEPDIETLRERFEACGQGHVFRFWDELPEAARKRLARQAARIDLEILKSLHAAQASTPASDEIEPIAVVRLPESGGDADRLRRAGQRGEELLSAGRIALLVVAGGQGSRLGFDGPKGCYPIGPVSERSLFALQAQRIRRLRRRFSDALPWYVMTSATTDAATRQFFAENDHFGLPTHDVLFFQQAMVPSLDFEGRLILEQPDRIFENPNGHGGSLTALLDSGALDDMERRGVETIFYYQVDNPMIRLADPTYLGLHAAESADMSCKVIRKLDPMEKMGVVARIAGRPGVIEYTELSDEIRHARDTSGEMVYWAGSIATHAFSVDFVRRVAGAADEWLPYHASAKKIPGVDDSGRPVVPREPNGRKLERFVFDALTAARQTCIVEADRDIEYSPVKTPDLGESVVKARRNLSSLYRGWLAEAGLPLPPAGIAIEIDHSRADDASELRALGIKSIEEAPDIIRTAPGAES